MTQQKYPFANKVNENFNALVSPIIEEPLRFTPKLKLGVLASGHGSNFEALVKSTINGQLDADIELLVVNNYECGAIRKAKKLQIDYKIIDHQKYKTRKEFDISIVNAFKDRDVEGIVMAGWMRIVTSSIINEYKDRLVNIHPSLLPSFRGINAIDKALNENVCISGCSVHIVNEEVDSGPILIQAAVPVKKGEKRDELHNRIQEMEHIILPLGVSIAADNWRNNKPYG